jgi:hypothetical protein
MGVTTATIAIIGGFGVGESALALVSRLRTRGKALSRSAKLTNLVSIFDSSNPDFSANRAGGLGRREGSCRSGKVASQSSRE